MKKAGIITIHNAYNYGAVLQSVATMKVIENLGVECELIDYDAPKFADDRQLFHKPDSISNIINDIRNLVSYKRLSQRKKAFVQFMNRNYKVSDKKYYCEDDFKSEDFNYDYYITGSDQTFSLHLRGDTEEMKPFFLKHAKNGKRISYASSMGEKMEEISEEEKAWLCERFRSYDSLSVREKLSVDYIERLTGSRPQLVMDPTFLMDKMQWDELSADTKYDKDDYILFYSVLSDKWVVDRVKEISKISGLKVIAPHPQNRFELATKFTRAEYCGPDEFVSLIKNAKFVVTTSFHATAFSINYNVPFITFLLGEGNRISSLLNTLGLQEQIVREDEDFRKIDFKNPTMDFKKANENLEAERRKSLKFLKKALDIGE
ncbi:MAG: polysaccharide pyruvyl transferase family protein [Oscillospiraceae bacterium]